MYCEVYYPDEEELSLPLPISWPELNSMKDLAAYWVVNATTKAERKLAVRLAHAAAWIEAEAKAIEAQGPVINIDSVS